MGLLAIKLPQNIKITGIKEAIKHFKDKNNM